MPIDNILYENELLMDISVINSGSSENILFYNIKGFSMLINQIHTGTVAAMLSKKQQMQTFSLSLEGGNTYSRSRVVNK